MALFSRFKFLVLILFVSVFVIVAQNNEDLLGRFPTLSKPDLVVASLSVNDDGALLIKEKNLTRTIVSGISSSTAIYVDDELLDSVLWADLGSENRISSLGSRELVSVEIQGLRQVTVCTDVYDLVDERNEGNNCLTTDVAGLDVEYVDGFAVFLSSNEDQGLDWFTDSTDDYRAEVDGTIFAIESKSALVLVPEAYLELGLAHAKDLDYCMEIIPAAYEMDFPADKVNLKRYSNPYDLYKSSSVFGWMMYSRGLEGLELDLNDLLTNYDEGFLYHLGPDNCSNAHEFTHTLLNDAPVPSWAEEGMAEYTQKLFQIGIEKDTCDISGYYHPETPDEITPYVDLSEAVDYPTSMCMIESLVDTYGWDSFLQVFDRIQMYQTGDLIWEAGTNYEFVEVILEPVFGADVYPFLQEWGIEPADYAL